MEVNEVSKAVNCCRNVEGIGVKYEHEQSSENGVMMTKFEKTTKKTNERYEVVLPWKARVDLADNLAVATKRLHILMIKPDKDANFMESYDATIRAYLEEGSSEKEPPTEDILRSLLYNMPHDPQPPRLSSVWFKWTEKLALPPDYGTPRFLGAARNGQNRASNLRIFVDASESAYGAVVYLTVPDASGNNGEVLLIAKMILAQLKMVPLARLELISALIEACFYSCISRNCQLEIKEVTFRLDGFGKIRRCGKL